MQKLETAETAITLMQEYTEKAKETAQYKTEFIGKTLTSWGLLEEIEEYNEKKSYYTTNFYRFSQEGNSESYKQEMLKELGDISWYLRVSMSYYTITFSENSLNNLIRDFNDCQLLYNRILTIDPYKTIAKIQGALKKTERDFAGIPSPEKIKTLSENYTNLLFFIIVEAQSLNYTLLEVLETNYQKLTKRRETGMIQGDGDNR